MGRHLRRLSRLPAAGPVLLLVLTLGGLGGACGDEDTTFGPSDAGADRSLAAAPG
jgi:hypothetical protein